MVDAKSLIHGRPAGPTLSPFHRLTLFMHVNQKTETNELIKLCSSGILLLFCQRSQLRKTSLKKSTNLTPPHYMLLIWPWLALTIPVRIDISI